MENIKKIIDDWDPIGLLSHAPNDEYNSEIDEIYRLLCTSNTLDELAEGVYNTFSTSFGKANFNKSMDECRQIARLLYPKRN